EATNGKTIRLENWNTELDEAPSRRLPREGFLEPRGDFPGSVPPLGAASCRPVTRPDPGAGEVAAQELGSTSITKRQEKNLSSAVLESAPGGADSVPWGPVSH